MHRTTRGPAAAALALAVLLGGCGLLDGPATDRSSAGTDAPSARAPEPSPTLPPTAADVRATGTPLGEGAQALVVRAELETATVTVEPQPDGSVAATVPVWARTIPPALVATLAAPEGTTFDVQVDGSVVLRDAAGAFVGGLAAVTATSADDTRWRASYAAADAADVLTVTVSPSATESTFDLAGTARVWFGSTVLESATWGEREGGRSLAVDPTPWARAGGLAGQDGTWAAVVAQEPEAGTNGMRDQFLCHAVGAPDKETWNLEPWRPDAGSLATLAARCNPE